MALTICSLSADGTLTTSDDPACVAGIIRDDKSTVWIDATSRDEVLEELLRETLGLHPLTIEDILSEREAPKVEEYEDFLYVIVHGVRTDPAREHQMSTIETDVVVGSNWVFTHHTVPMMPLDELREDLARNPRILTRGPAFLAHAILDHLVDCYRPVVEFLDDTLAELEREIVTNPSTELMTRAFSMKREVHKLRRITVYQREVLHRLARGEFDRVGGRALPFFRDVYDEFNRVTDLVDSYREVLSSVIEIHISVTANRTNEIMKVLAIISTVMLPLTFIAGVYGMNFQHMPELRWRYGYPMALCLMAVVATMLIAWFRKRRWI